MNLKTSVIITIVLMFLCFLSDKFLGTQYMGNTYFQPFPHLLIFGIVFLDLILWYEKRKEDARTSVPPKAGTRTNKILLFVIIVYVMAVAGLVAEYFTK